MRDPSPPYGVEAADDRYPADEVLADLRTAADAQAMARILARYAALRHWLLRVERAPAEVTAHAAEAARAHLAALERPTGEAPAEATLLGHLLDATPTRACGLLAAAAEEAARAGDAAGAGALRRAARDAMVFRLRNPRRRPPPS